VTDAIHLHPISSYGTAGPVMIIGGAEDKFRDKVILSRFAKFAGGKGGHVVVISTVMRPRRCTGRSSQDLGSRR